ncbi:MAG: diaminopimelate epimerase [Actinomycetota bacterium]|nr:diaminopimelate epimerase [Actinomycetota bacterium]
MVEHGRRNPLGLDEPEPRVSHEHARRIEQYPEDMRFTKAHATGNDFVVLPDWDDALRLEPDLVRLLCDRRRGLGADGVIRLVRGPHTFMDYRNADGSLAEICGNGLRVAAKYVVDRAIVHSSDGSVLIDTRAGTRKVTVRLGSGGRVEEATVDMGPPNFHPAAVPFEAPDQEAIDVPVTLDGSLIRLTALSFGNPHAVVVVDEVASAPLETVGAALEHHPRFPERVNVEFAEVAGPREVRVRVWERGVGETAGCGSGACAVLVALRRLGVVSDEATLHFPGGDVHVRYEPTRVLLTGSALEIASGELDPTWLAEASSDAPPHRASGDERT